MSREMPMGTNNQVCAIFTTFHPGPETVHNIASAISQVQQVTVVDNGSGADSVAYLRSASAKLGFHLIENGSNLGIASALNIGCKWAIEQGNQFLILFDQDSEATEGLISNLLDAYDKLKADEKVGLVGAKILDRITRMSPPLLLDHDYRPTLTLTSGSLFPAKVIEECGGFEEDLFIEYVDHEYCLRIRSHGYRIVIVDDAVLLHEVGYPRIHRLLGIWSCRCTHHAAERRYYHARNLTVLLFRYWEKEPAWCLTEVQAFVKTTIKSLLFEKHRTRRLWFTLRGCLDAITGRMGERVEL